jgi:hypothetical protein
MTRSNGTNSPPAEWPAAPRDPNAQHYPYHDDPAYSPSAPNGHDAGNGYDAGYHQPAPWPQHEPPRPAAAAQRPPNIDARANAEHSTGYDPWDAIPPAKQSFLRHVHDQNVHEETADVQYHYPRTAPPLPAQPPATSAPWPPAAPDYVAGTEPAMDRGRTGTGYVEPAPYQPQFNAYPRGGSQPVDHAPAPTYGAGYADEAQAYDPTRAYPPTDTEHYPPVAHGYPPPDAGRAEPIGHEPDHSPASAWELRGAAFDHHAEPALPPMPDPRLQHAAADGYAPSLDPQYGRAYEAPPHMPDIALRHDGYSQDQRYDPFALPPAQQRELAPQENAYDGEYDEDEDYVEERSGMGRKLLIGGALVASIAVGGGIAYGYNTLFGVPSGKHGTPPVIKADGSPSRVEPTDPGGRQFPHTDSRVLEKMGQRLPTAAAAGPEQTDDSGRVKVVTTMTFDRNGRMVVTNAPEAPADGSTPAPIGTATASPQQPLPGMTIMNGNAFGPQSEPVSAPPARTGESAPLEPQLIAVTRSPPPRTETGTRGNIPPLPTRSSPEPSSEPPTSVAPVRPQPPPQRTAAAAPPRVSATNGYVAVLATKGSRMEALKSFVDLQTRYGSVLGSKIPDVQKADLSARNLGIQYRAIVGPPGSRKAALQVCTELRSAGYQGCWVKAY